VEKEPFELTGVELSLAAPNIVFLTEIFASGAVVPEMWILSITTSDEKLPFRPRGVRSCVTGFRTSEGPKAVHNGNVSDAKNTKIKTIATIRRFLIAPVKSIIPMLAAESSS
jgi:hypothetical protein